MLLNSSQAWVGYREVSFLKTEPQVFVSSSVYSISGIFWPLEFVQVKFSPSIYGLKKRYQNLLFVVEGNVGEDLSAVSVNFVSKSWMIRVELMAIA